MKLAVPTATFASMNSTSLFGDTWQTLATPASTTLMASPAWRDNTFMVQRRQ